MAITKFLLIAQALGVNIEINVRGDSGAISPPSTAIIRRAPGEGHVKRDDEDEGMHHHNNISAGSPSHLSKVAFVTFLSSEPKPGMLSKLDGAGVLAESIREHMGHLKPDLLVIVTSAVKQRTRSRMETFGYKIIDLPSVDLSKISDELFRGDVARDGCCGADEMLKLEPYRMTQYDRVVVMDTDTLVHSSFEELLTLDKTTLYTAPFKEANKEALQGAILILRPNPLRYQEIMDTFYAANFSDKGWNNSGVGWSWGGRTVQGILPYFTEQVHPEDSKLLDHCVYNHNGGKAANYCVGRDFHKAKVNHFTLCQKPWYCFPYEEPDQAAISPSCLYFLKAWWATRARLANRLGKGADNSSTLCNQYTVDAVSPAYPPLLSEI